MALWILSVVAVVPTPEHIKAFADAMQGIAPRKLPEIKTAMRLSGLEPLNIDDESLFVNVGERNNVTGSAKFKRLIKEDKFAEAIEIAIDQVENGAQVIDVNMDEALLDGKKMHDPLPQYYGDRAGCSQSACHDRLV